MNYMGSKSKNATEIAYIINKYIAANHITEFYDIFCGGANLTDKICCDNVYANDLSPTLIALHKQMQQDKSLIPDSGNRETWDKCKAEYERLLKLGKIDLDYWKENSSIPLYEIGANEWYSSYVCGGFPRGFANNTAKRKYYNERMRNHIAQSKTSKYQAINFMQGNYLDLSIPENALIYSDAPYKNTKPYQINKKFDFEQYYNWLWSKSLTNPIFISEQEMPENFEKIWENKTQRTANKNRIYVYERLYFIDRRTKE